jgi:integrase
MSIWYDKPRNRWRYDFKSGGQRFAGMAIDPVTGKPAVTKTEAKLIINALRVHAAREGKHTAMPRSGAFTLAMAMGEVLQRVGGKGDELQYKKYVREFLDFYGPATPIVSITKARIQDYIDWALKQKINIYIGGPRKQKSDNRKLRAGSRMRSANTVKRHLNALRKAFEIAHSLTAPGAQQPYLPRIPEFPSIPTVKRMARPPDEMLLARMMEEAPQHLRDAIAICVLMGFRKAELFGLQSSHVDLDKCGVWLDGEKTKGRRDEFVPANEAAMQILRRLVKEADAQRQKHLILYYPPKRKSDGYQPPPHPIKDARSAWRRLCKKFNVKGQHRFHDLRAAYITALAHHAPARVVQELARHKSMTTTQGYIRIADSAQRLAVEAIGKDRPMLRLISAGARNSNL